jgi:hypothetical protein
MAILRPLVKSQYEVSFTALNGPTFTAVFTKFSGVKDNAEESKYANGTGNRLYHVIGPRTVDDVTLTAPYDPTVFKELEQFWIDYNCQPVTVTVTPRDCQGTGSAATGGQYILYECQFRSVTTADVDRESGNVQTIECMFTVNYWDRT